MPNNKPTVKNSLSSTGTSNICHIVYVLKYIFGNKQTTKLVCCVLAISRIFKQNIYFVGRKDTTLDKIHRSNYTKHIDQHINAIRKK